jgi:hypothetical protein
MLMLLLPCLVCSSAAISADPVTLDRKLKAKVYQPVAPIKATASFAPVTKTQIRKFNTRLYRPVEPDKEVEPTGPNPAMVLDLSDSIENADLLQDLGVASGWDPHLVFQDKTASNVFYYLPREILLRRDEQGYRLSVQYNTMAEAGDPSVMLTAELEASQRKGDVNLLKAILREALGLKSSDKLKLKSLQGLGATADMQALTAGLALSADRVHLAAPSHLKQSFRLTLALTQDEVEEVLAQISREGLAGSLNVKVGNVSVPIPIRIQYSHFAGEQLQGFDQWLQSKPTGKITNTTDFPLQLASLNAYRLHSGRLERISKQLKQGKAISPKQSRAFKLPPVNKVLGSNLLVAWPETHLDSSCVSCVQRIDQVIRQGVALAQGSRIKLEAIPGVFSEFGLYKLLIHVRSPFFVAGGTAVEEREIELTEDSNKDDSLVVYIPSGRQADALIYRYRIQLVTETGESIEDQVWHDASNLNQFFGSSQLQGLLGEQEQADVEGAPSSE